ncbi:ciliary microtubule associated protein 1A-like [Saccoglossus kowalevskii]|uniref:Outer dense fiber protein 3-like n=1 Tax=Saccoglossus kowalevskii TaxID=10224 RepID=A0ABM0GLV6_SACKO|nr:PREDICTED: outer dense fiber protein 3-like [Saccoglossus kowalevskii]
MAEDNKNARPIIAAREKGPGPGRYALPSSVGFIKHDHTKHMRPAYSFGQRLENSMFRKDCSPGPGYYIDPRVTRGGRDGTPAYSILGRQIDPNQFKTPCPRAYCPEKVHPQGERHAPSYSMGARTRYRKRDAVPAPNSYTLPPLLGPKVPNNVSCPSYSMTGQAKTGSYLTDLTKTPGPGRYNATAPDVNASKAPVYSMLSRSYMPGDGTQKPGPGAYSPEKVVVNKPKPPIYSLGIRHSEYVTPLFIDAD